MTSPSVAAFARTVRRSWKMGTAMATTAGPSSQLIHSVACLKSSYRRPVSSRMPTMTTIPVNPGCRSGTFVHRNTRRQAK